MQKDHIRTLKILQYMSEFGGLWKPQNNPACTKSFRAFSGLKLDIIGKKKKREFQPHIHTYHKKLLHRHLDKAGHRITWATKPVDIGVRRVKRE